MGKLYYAYTSTMRYSIQADNIIQAWNIVKSRLSDLKKVVDSNVLSGVLVKSGFYPLEVYIKVERNRFVGSCECVTAQNKCICAQCYHDTPGACAYAELRDKAEDLYVWSAVLNKFVKYDLVKI